MRTKKALKNLIASIGYQIISIICGLITPRLILSNFGSTYNGVINSVTQLLGMISILTLGITGATRVVLYKTLGTDDILGTSRIIKATKIYMRKVAICLIGYVFVLCFVYPLISHNSLSKMENVFIILIVSIDIFAQYYFGISNQTLLQADQSSYIINLLDIIKIIINTICVVLLIRITGNVYVVKLGSSLIFFLTPIVMNIYVQKKYKLIYECSPDNTGIEQRGAVAFLSIANLVHNNVDLFFLTLFTDAKIISVYTIYYLVVSKVKSLIQIATTGMEAAFGNMWVKGEKEAFNKNFNGFEYIVFSLTAIVFSCVSILIVPFVICYTTGVNDVDYIRYDIAILMTIAEALFCFRQPYMTIVQATGHYKETKNGAAMEAIINIIVSLILINIIGVSGVIIGTIVANFFRTIQYAVFVSKNVLKRSISIVIKRFIWSVSVVAVVIMIFTSINNLFVFTTDWNGWFVEAVVVFIISCVVCFIMSLVFYKTDFIFVFNFTKRMVMKR